MKFAAEQRFSFPPDVTAQAFVDPDLYQRFAELPKLSVPEVLSRDARPGAGGSDIVTMRIRYRFAGHLSRAARTVIDPAKLSWVDESVHDLARRHVRFVLHPDHYADRFQCHGEYRIEEVAGGCRRVASIDVRVSAPLVARAVEQAIASGLREHLADETTVIERFLRERSAL